MPALQASGQGFHPLCLIAQDHMVTARLSATAGWTHLLLLKNFRRFQQTQSGNCFEILRWGRTILSYPAQDAVCYFLGRFGC